MAATICREFAMRLSTGRRPRFIVPTARSAEGGHGTDGGSPMSRPGHPKKIGSVWVTRSMGVAAVASPALGAGGVIAEKGVVKDRRIAKGTSG